MKNFGETIKKLRKQKDMTQEQLAEYLNISSQSVSKWETNLTLPDITLLPILANIFDVTSDTLLGIDIDAKEKRIDEIVEEARKYDLQGQLNETEKILRAGLKEYPNSYRLMAYLASNLQNLAKREKEEEPQTAMRAEVISLCEKVLAECVKDKIRYMAIQCLCFAYVDIGDMDKARDLADKMPDKAVSSNYLLNFVLKGKEKYEHIQKEMAKNIYGIFADIINLNNHYAVDVNKGVYNLDECIALHHKVLDIINIICEDGNFGSYNWLLADTHRQLCYFGIQKKDTDTAVKHLKLSAKHAILVDAIPRAEDDEAEREFTSLLFRGMKVSVYKSNHKFGQSYRLLERIESGEFNSHLPTDEINAIADELRKYVKK